MDGTATKRVLAQLRCASQLANDGDRGVDSAGSESDIRLDDGQQGELLLGCHVCCRLLVDPVTTCRGWTMCRRCYASQRKERAFEHMFTPGLDLVESPQFGDVVVRNLLTACYSKESEILNQLRCGQKIDTNSVVGLDVRVQAEVFAAHAESCRKEGKGSEALEALLQSIAIRGLVTRQAEQLLRGMEEEGVGFDSIDEKLIAQIQDRAKVQRTGALLPEKPQLEDLSILECFCCSNLLYQPSTFPTGHAVCRGCMQRTLEVTNPSSGMASRPVCPMTREPLDDFAAWIHSRPDNLPVNRTLERVIKTFAGEEYEKRREQVETEMKEHMSEDGFVPIFVCALAWPGVPFKLHVFEPRYRLMVRRCMETGFRRFGMVAPGLDIGTMLLIRDQAMLSDGRSLLDTVGLRRFRVLERSQRDGYCVAKIEYFDDEDDLSNAVNSDEERTTRDEMLATAQKCREEVKGLMTRHGISQLGELPSDPGLLSFWMCASMESAIFKDEEVLDCFRMTSLAERWRIIKPYLSPG